ncbi:hypothetical protein [Bradyrhizobium sp. 2S1]|uniref:hypothetical protein n=1 Tax=Bradyrhizobium sp. 2S1 TaxID=1404429 RepID=UPI0014089207|nr:hypothetical protein [Bradyrhizobium sp. 2S1]MCK7665045.1 hypothetical protein [Bradyrhizobium sp. 2S1]
MSTGSQDSNCQSETKPDPDCPPELKHPPFDDEAPDPRILEQARKAALASATQGIADATDDLFSSEPDKVKKRNDIFKKYKTDIAPEPGGPVRAKFEKAIGMFESAMADLLCEDKSTTCSAEERQMPSADKEKKTRFDKWLHEQLDPPTYLCDRPEPPYCYWKFMPLYGLFFRKKQVGRRLDESLATRELALRDARNTTKGWADAFKAWSDPGKSIEDTIGSSIGDLEKINADILSNTNADYAIYRLLFEVAPRLIQVAPADRPLKNGVGQAILRLSSALVDFPERKRVLCSGKARKDGSVYLIPVSSEDGKDDPMPLQTERKGVLEAWTISAEKLAEADADFTLRKDDAPSLKTRFDTLVQTEAKLVQDLLAPPTP